MFGSQQSAPTPAPPPLPDPLPTPPTFASGTKGGPSGNANKVPSFGGTLLTSAMGVDSSAATTKKSLLGL